MHTYRVWNSLASWPLMLAVEFLLGSVAGCFMSKGEWRLVRPVAVALAVVIAVTVTTLLIFGWVLDMLPFDLPVGNWYLLMVGMGIYESAGFLSVAIVVPWAPVRTRAKAFLAILSGAIVLGQLTYGGGDLMMNPDVTEHLVNFAVSAIIAMLSVAVGHLGARMSRSGAHAGTADLQ